ncbi:hypothetical protein MJO29_012806 [Puccinia striiformis f. sp. tritici]|uniref:Uncharacterized protein n=2 Tax=Puccinia striiformis TaxID=27350 RepID=A0A2S4W2C2_9BASI|nr:hypothetical protein MJO29_012806 [Puccinia striiformis f. sp. tritici]POW15930.1 hypothetical protein PSTT_01763 [Puccinia striiformis]POW22946.1 hypothetical protein PSHT_00650 [Puccinia striiformis]
MSIRSFLIIVMPLIIGSLCLFGSKINAASVPSNDHEGSAKTNAASVPSKDHEGSANTNAASVPSKDHEGTANSTTVTLHLGKGTFDLYGDPAPMKESVSMGPQLRRLLALNPTKGGRRPAQSRAGHLQFLGTSRKEAVAAPSRRLDFHPSIAASNVHRL